jgi:hypothetical protein
MKFAKGSPFSIVLLASLSLAPIASRADAPATQPATYTNPLPVHVADPFIFREGDTYYLYGTAAGDGLLAWTSRTS